MKIALLSPIHWRTPPRKYGPWELVASYIAEGMVKAGHKVTLYATGDSKTSGNLSSVCPRPLMEDPTLESKVYQYLHSSAVFEKAGDYDIIHNHYDAYPLVFSKLVKTPVITTIHGFSSPQVSQIYRKYKNTFYVSISMADRAHAPDLNYLANIYHGIPVGEYPFNPKPEKYFCYVGRISPDKGVHLSVRAAKDLGLNFKIAGLIDKAHESFFEREIQPFLGRKIKYLGLVSEVQKRNILKNAVGFLHLNTYNEGFGLALIEALAYGTPVIGMKLGSIPEIIENGKCGFVISNFEEAKEAIKKIEQIDRNNCRKVVEQKFSLEKMISEYEKAYKKVLTAFK